MFVTNQCSFASNNVSLTKYASAVQKLFLINRTNKYLNYKVHYEKQIDIILLSDKYKKSNQTILHQDR